MTTTLVRTLLAGSCLVAFPAPGVAQAPPQSQAQPPAVSEDVEPRVVGGRGLTTIGLAGFVDRSFSAEASLPTTYVAQVDGSRFLTDRIAVRVGLVGAGRFGGSAEDDRPTGARATALHGLGGLQFHFTPRSIASFYLGTEYWLQLTERADRERGSVLWKAGLVGSLSSRASVFVEGGYGVRLTRGDDDELVTRAVAQIGVRIKL